MSSRTLRLFVAAYPPEDSRRAMLDSLQAVSHRVGVPYRAVPIGQVHMTVQFIGAIRERQLEEVVHSVERSASGLGAFHLTPMGLITLPEKGPPRLIAMETDAPPTLLEAHRRLAMRLAGSPRAKSAEGFLPHLTLGRFGGEVRANRVAQPSSQPPFEVRSLRLMRSVLKPQGAEHILVAEFPL